MAAWKSCQHISCQVWLKFKKVFKTELVSCFTIWFSSRAPTLHPRDLLARPSDLKASHKSIGLPTHFLSLIFFYFFLFFAMRFCTLYFPVLYVFLMSWSLDFLYICGVCLALKFFLKSLYQTIPCGFLLFC